MLYGSPACLEVVADDHQSVWPAPSEVRRRSLGSENGRSVTPQARDPGPQSHSRSLTCGSHVVHAVHMPKMIQIRNVPDDLHRVLTIRAAQEGLSLSDYLLAEVRRVSERPTLAEFRERLRTHARVSPRVSPTRAIRQERDRR